MEIWKDIEGYEGLYQVSNLGRVKSLKRVVHQNQKGGQLTPMIYKGRILKINYHTTIEYGFCQLSKDNIQETKLIHRLVAEAFIPNPNNYPCVNHRNEDKTDNRVENLEWCTQRYNVNYGTSRERASINNPLCKRIKVDGLVFRSICEAERFLNCPKNALFQVLKNNKNTYKGHKIERVS